MSVCSAQSTVLEYCRHKYGEPSDLKAIEAYGALKEPPLKFVISRRSLNYSIGLLTIWSSGAVLLPSSFLIIALHSGLVGISKSHDTIQAFVQSSPAISLSTLVMSTALISQSRLASAPSVAESSPAMILSTLVMSRAFTTPSPLASPSTA